MTTTPRSVVDWLRHGTAATPNQRNESPCIKLASSLGVTVAMIPACKGAREPEGCQPLDCVMNPPPPPPTATAAPTADATIATTPTAAPTATAVATALPTSTAAATATPTAKPTAIASALKALPPGMSRSADGRCWQQVDAHCPPFDPKRPRTSNPPGPREVPCP